MSNSYNQHILALLHHLIGNACYAGLKFDIDQAMTAKASHFNKRGETDWNSFASSCPKSETALQLISQHGSFNKAKKHLRIEHSKPMNLLIKELRIDPTINKIHTVLESYHVTIITREEDRLLTKAKLNSKMPLDWDGKDPYARYHAVGIVVIKQ